MLREFLFYAIRISVGFVDLVNGDNDGNLRSARVFDCLDSLGHDAIVCGHDEHDDVSGLGSARAHHSESLVTRRIEKDNAARFLVLRIRHLDTIGANVLRDATGFTAGHIGGANAVEQRSLP